MQQEMVEEEAVEIRGMLLLGCCKAFAVLECPEPQARELQARSSSVFYR
jgi:hypothetical protein